MGGFALCIENATRDIQSLLTLHRVHPQVHADIQRILGSLLRKQYTDMTVLHSPELTDSPEQVCRAIVDHIIDDTFSTAIPAANITALQKTCAQLTEEKDALETEAVKAEHQLAEVQAVLRHLKDAHDYMLHSYFREVLMLRSRIDDLQRQNRAYRAQAAAIPVVNAGTANSVLATSMGSQLQQFLRSSSGGGGNGGGNGVSPGKDGAASRRLGMDDVAFVEAATASGSSAPSTTSFAAREGKVELAADGVVVSSRSPLHNLAETRRGTSGDESPRGANGQIGSTAATAASTSKSAMSPTPRGKDRNVRIASLFTGGSPRRPTMTVQTTTTCEVLPPTEPESVDAIFDYEAYIRILNGERGSWVKRFVAVTAEPDGGARRRRRSVRVRTRTFSDVLLRDSDPMALAEAPFDDLEQQQQQQEEQELQQTRTRGFRWLLHLALEPIQHRLHTELSQLRQAVHTLQKEHARDVQAISRALLQVQSRNDGLLDFLETFVQETQRTIAVLARDSRARTVTDLLFSGPLPVEKSVNVSTFFTPSTAPSSLGVGSPNSSLSPPPPLTQLADIVGADAVDATIAASSAASHALHPRKEWRLKPAARLSSADSRVKRHDTAKAAAVTTAPPTAHIAANYYRADLGLPYWSAHPITMHAQAVFEELQLAAKEMRVSRVQQLYAYEEATANGSTDGRRVRFDKSPQDGDGSSSSRRHRHETTSTPVETTPDSFYGADVAEDGSGGIGGSGGGSAGRPRRRLQDGWQTRTVTDGGGVTGGDLLQELVHLRMRRACDQVRLARVRDTMLRAFYPKLAEQQAAAAAAGSGPATRTKRGKQIPTTARLKPTEMPPLDLTSPEAVLKHQTLQRLQTDTEKRLGRTSQRIAELQRLLEMHFVENEMQEVVDHTSAEKARQVAKEEAAGLYRVNGEVKSTAQLWSSPYLNDAHGPGGLVRYLPIGLASTVDADGNVSGGAGAVVMLGGTPISVAPYAARTTRKERTAERAEESDGGDAKAGEGRQGDGEGSDETKGIDEASYNAPYVAVMDYCRGVQLGRPVGHRGGPVYVFQDASSGAYYVGDAEGRPVIQDDMESEEIKAATEENADGTPAPRVGSTAATTAAASRPALAMTRILYPAPQRDASPTDSDAAVPLPTITAGTSTTTSNALQPVYLVPMAIPLSDEEAIVREGWQACHRHGHTRQDPIFYTTLSPLPLSSSYHHVVPQVQDGRSGEAACMEGQGTGSTTAAATANNKYLVNPPRVFQPPDEASSMVRVRALRLQKRTASESGCYNTTTAPSSTMDNGSGDGGNLHLADKGSPHGAPSPPQRRLAAGDPTSVFSDSTNPGVTASPADTAFTTPPISAQPTVLSSSSARPSPRPLDSLYVSPTATTAPAMAAAAAASDGLQRPLAASTPAAATLPHCTNAGLASTTPLPGSSSTSMTAAVLLAKQQRAARLAREAEAATQLNTQRQEAWQQQHSAEGRALTQTDAFLRLPHLTPLLSHGTSSSTTSAASLLPPVANSARLQRQMRPEKYSLTPPPPSSRRSEPSKPSSSE